MDAECDQTVTRGTRGLLTRPGEVRKGGVSPAFAVEHCALLGVLQCVNF